jgi:hypothetical protein
VANDYSRGDLITDLATRLYLAGEIAASFDSKDGLLATKSEERFSAAEKAHIGKMKILEISSARSEGDPESPEFKDNVDEAEPAYLFGASQANSDLAQVAQWESDGTFFKTENEFFDLLRSPMYWKMREIFVHEAEQGDTYALLTLVWRAYKAGRISPKRLLPTGI